MKLFGKRQIREAFSARLRHRHNLFRYIRERLQVDLKNSGKPVDRGATLMDCEKLDIFVGAKVHCRKSSDAKFVFSCCITKTNEDMSRVNVKSPYLLFIVPFSTFVTYLLFITLFLESI